MSEWRGIRLKEFQQETEYRLHGVLVQASKTPFHSDHTLLSRMFIFLDLELSGGVTRQAVGHPSQAVRTVAFR